MVSVLPLRDRLLVGKGLVIEIDEVGSEVLVKIWAEEWKEKSEASRTRLQRHLELHVLTLSPSSRTRHLYYWMLLTTTPSLFPTDYSYPSTSTPLSPPSPSLPH